MGTRSPTNGRAESLREVRDLSSIRGSPVYGPVGSQILCSWRWRLYRFVPRADIQSMVTTAQDGNFIRRYSPSPHSASPDLSYHRLMLFCTSGGISDDQHLSASVLCRLMYSILNGHDNNYSRGSRGLGGISNEPLHDSGSQTQITPS